MSMKDFPPTPFPEGVECRHLTGFSIKIIKHAIEEGRCETCHKEMATVIFNVGATQHNLCKDCFEEMMRTFAEKSNSVLVKNVECTRMVSGHFDFTGEQLSKEDCNVVYRYRDCIYWSNGDHCAKWKSNCCPKGCGDYKKLK